MLTNVGTKKEDHSVSIRQIIPEAQSDDTVTLKPLPNRRWLPTFSQTGHDIAAWDYTQYFYLWACRRAGRHFARIQKSNGSCLPGLSACLPDRITHKDAQIYFGGCHVCQWKGAEKRCKIVIQEHKFMFPLCRHKEVNPGGHITI